METQEGNQKDMYWTETYNMFNNSEYVKKKCCFEK